MPSKAAEDAFAALLSPNNVWLAPMAGVTDPIFRGLCIEQGAGLSYTEMISATALAYRNEHAWRMLSLGPGEKRCAIQLFGHDADMISEQAARIEDEWGSALALIDINMGCPMPKLTKGGDGSALMKTPELAAAIIEKTSSRVSVPVTAKFRKGYGGNEETAPEFAKLLEDAGAAAVCVHGRTAAQLYRGTCDWESIAHVKEAVSIPVIGSGDIFSQDDISHMFERCGVDGVVVARGARGNPWIFSGHVPTPDERIDMAQRHAHGLCETDTTAGVKRMKKHVAWYLAGIYQASSIRDEAMHCETIEQLDAVFEMARDLQHTPEAQAARERQLEANAIRDSRNAEDEEGTSL